MVASVLVGDAAPFCLAVAGYIHSAALSMHVCDSCHVYSQHFLCDERVTIVARRSNVWMARSTRSGFCAFLRPSLRVVQESGFSCVPDIFVSLRQLYNFCTVAPHLQCFCTSPRLVFLLRKGVRPPTKCASCVVQKQPIAMTTGTALI